MDLTKDICKTINQKICYVNTIFNEELEKLGLINEELKNTKFDAFNNMIIGITNDGLICGKIYYIVDILNYMKNLQIIILDNNFDKLFKDLLMCELIYNSILKSDYIDFKDTKEYICKLYLEIRTYISLLLFNRFESFDDNNIIKIIVLLDKVNEFKKYIIYNLLRQVKNMKRICDFYAKYDYFYKVIERCPLNWDMQYEFYKEYSDVIMKFISEYFADNKELSYKKFKELTIMTLGFEKLYNLNPIVSKFITDNYMNHYLEIKNNYYDAKINNLLNEDNNGVTFGIFNKACTLILIIKKIIKDSFCISDGINSEMKIHQYIYQYENYLNKMVKGFTITECFIGLNSLEYINKSKLKLINIDKYACHCLNILSLKNINLNDIKNIEVLNEDSNKYMILAYLFEKYKNDTINIISSYEDLMKIETNKEIYLGYSTFFTENEYKVMWVKYINMNIDYIKKLTKLFIIDPKNILSAIRNLDISKDDILLIIDKIKMDIGMKKYITNQINKFYV